MGNMYNRIEELCNRDGISITRMCQLAHVARAPLTELKKGRTKELNVENASKIADFFGVSVSYLRGKKETPAAESDGRDTIDLSGLDEDQREKQHYLRSLLDIMRILCYILR